MVMWLKDNVLALLLICTAGVSAYTLSVSRIAVLEVKVAKQEERSIKTDMIIENNTTALTKISVLFARIDGKLDTFEFRVHELEKNKEEERNEQRIARTSL